jgi:hypothetical protein
MHRHPRKVVIRPLFLVGNKRSGSTFFGRFLSSHPSVFITGESDVIWILYCSYVLGGIRPYPFDDDFGMNATLARIGGMLDTSLTPYENFLRIQQHLIRVGHIKHGPAVRDQLAYIGDQKPFQQIDPSILPFIQEHFPGSKFIHLVRHPAAVASSAKRFGGGTGGRIWGGMTLDEILKRWEMHEDWVIQARKGGLEILDVRYEDLLTRPRRSLRRICRYLELPCEDEDAARAAALVNKRFQQLPRLSYTARQIEIMSLYGYGPRNALNESGWIMRLLESLHFRWRKYRRRLNV